MTTPEPAISFRTLLAYTDFLAQRWIKYFNEHPDALDVDIGGKMDSLRTLIGHIFQVEEYFAGCLLQEAPPRPTSLPPSSMEELKNLHQQAHEKLSRYISSASEEELQRTQTFGPLTVSNRKLLTQTVLHSIHHWAQVAMEVRQAGFPTEMPQDIIITDVMA